MAYNLQDQEQIDELKAFWANNGNRLMWLAVIALAVFAGWRAWNWYHDGQAQDAAREYAGLLSAADAGKIEQVRERYDAIQKGYGSSVYAGMAGLRAAEAFAKANQPDAAAAALENVMKNSTEPGFKPIAGVRLAGLLLDQKKYDEATKAIDSGNIGPVSGEMAASVADRRGDILAAQFPFYRYEWSRQQILPNLLRVSDLF